MTWNHLYEHCYNWSESTLAKRISSLENFGSPEEIIEVADMTGSEAIADRLIRKAIEAGVRFSPANALELDGLISEDMMIYVVKMIIGRGKAFTYDQLMELDGLVDEETVTAVMCSMIDHGFSFSADQILELDGLVDTKALNIAAKYSKAHFTPEQLTELDGVVDEKILLEIDKRQGTQTFDYDDDESATEPDHPKQERKPGRLFTSLAFLGELSSGRKKPRSCFRVGDHVRVRYNGMEGIIIDINGDLYMVSMKGGNKVDSYYEDQIERAR